MKKLLLFLFSLGIVFMGSFAAANRLGPLLKEKERASSLAKNHFKPSQFPLKNNPFAIVVVGYNNGATVAKTLASVFSQKYENYRLIYIDDASNDGSFDLARDLIYESEQIAQVTLVQNERRLGTLANIARAVDTCQNEEIVVILQGEDWLAHEWVLQRLNGYYADPDLWLTYGQYMDFPTYKKGICREYRENRFRTQPFFASHLKTFYAALFKKIRQADFIYSGQFFPACSDMAYMIPMLEMGKDHYHLIPEVLYISNSQTVGKEDREMQLRCEKFIRALDPYSSLSSIEVIPCGE